jgi:hypothetical protein
MPYSQADNDLIEGQNMEEDEGAAPIEGNGREVDSVEASPQPEDTGACGIGQEAYKEGGIRDHDPKLMKSRRMYRM